MSRCKSCQALISWGKTANGKATPINEDGSPHWGTCPQRREWRKDTARQESFSDLAAPRDEKREYPS